MPWPDFTELTFGFAFLRELEQNYVLGGKFPKAPDFISQGAEATKGYDVEVTLDGSTPLFIQLKRSYVLVRNSAREIQDGLYAAPKVYRMNLHKNGKYRQHKALQGLEALGNAVFYVTSQIHTPKEFSDAYSAGTVVSQASAMFAPNEIILPDDTKDHHVSFKPNDSFGYVYSKEPHPFERKFQSFDSWLPVVGQRAQSAIENRQLLEKTVEFLKKKRRPRDPVLQMIRDQPLEAQAAILAYFILDAQLTFVKT
ncbi:hypothetical protein FAP39_16960 [Shimia litoralis]|uniref:Uncharacterized protein n=1 Tax=Shimia litoralis TaxID=420403 RepID=A0A4U7MS00_9RHOB|nr:hypothetical protein [Shimia litoralis]TKZ15750.1 hypothetical protein FAP39_16960 [Shimia litoralis]